MLGAVAESLLPLYLTVMSRNVGHQLCLRTLPLHGFGKNADFGVLIAKIRSQSRIVNRGVAILKFARR